MEYIGNIVKIIINVVLLIIFVGLVIVGQKEIGYTGLVLMIAGLLGILGLLYIYNKKHK